MHTVHFSLRRLQRDHEQIKPSLKNILRFETVHLCNYLANYISFDSTDTLSKIYIQEKLSSNQMKYESKFFFLFLLRSQRITFGENFAKYSWCFRRWILNFAFHTNI